MPYRLASRRQRWQYRAIVAAWVISQVSFWTWWLQQDHVVTLVGMFLNSLLLVWTTFLPAWLLFFVGRAKRPNPALPLPEGRVAMVVTKAPSEPWPLVRSTLQAMLAQEFHRTRTTCGWRTRIRARNTRLVHRARRHRCPAERAWPAITTRSWPRREKCKEGNLAYFYEVMGGYERVRLRCPAGRRPRPGADLPDGDGASLCRPDGWLCSGAQHV